MMSLTGYVVLQDKQHGFIGITVYTFGLVPLTNAEKDKVAVQRVFDYFVGWYVTHPATGSLYIPYSSFNFFVSLSLFWWRL